MNTYNAPKDTFDFSPHLLPIQIYRTFRWGLRSSLSMIHDMGHKDITAEHIILFGCLDNGHISLIDLAKRMFIPPATALQLVDECAAQGYLKWSQKTCQDDQKLISYTENGLNVLNDLSNVMAQGEHILSHRIGSKNVNTLKRILSCDWGSVLRMNEIELNAEINKGENPNMGL